MSVAAQAFAFAQLTAGRALTFVLEGVLAGLELQTKRCPAQVQLCPEHARKIALIGARKRLCLVPVYDEQGRVGPSLVRVTKLDAPPMHERWWVVFDRLV